MDSPVLSQLRNAGYLADVVRFTETASGVHGTMRLSVLPRLWADNRFASGHLHGLHADVGKHRCDFRSFNGACGSGSLQIVIDRRTGRFWADIDQHNPYQDVVRFVGHAFGEVVPHWVKRVFKRRKQGVSGE